MKAILAGKNPDEVNLLSIPHLSDAQADTNETAVVPYKRIPVMTNKNNPNDLIDLSKEEDREKDGVRLVVERYNQLFRYLFDRYTSHQKRLSSDFVSERTLKVIELLKLFRDHNIDHSMLSKHEVQQFTLKINNKLLLKYGNEALTYTGFV